MNIFKAILQRSLKVCNTKLHTIKSSQAQNLQKSIQSKTKIETQSPANVFCSIEKCFRWTAAYDYYLFESKK